MSRTWLHLPLFIFSLSLLIPDVAFCRPLIQEVPLLAQSLGKQLVAKKRPKVAILDFTTIKGQRCELGRFVVEQMVVNMVSIEGMTVVDRGNIDAIMAEHKLTTEGLIKPENAKKLGQFAGVEAILVGSVAAMDNMFILTVKAISTETSEVVAAGTAQFDMTPDMMKQFGSGMSDGGAPAGGGENSKIVVAEVVEPKGIATKKFKNLEIVLLTVTRSSAKDAYGDDTPAVECGFEIFNRDVRNTAVIAVNGKNMTQNIYSGRTGIQLAGYRGGLTDSDGGSWVIPSGMLQGISAILCIDYVSTNVNDSIDQNNPSSAVSYIRRGRRCEMGPGRQAAIRTSGKYWTGDFSTISPAGSTRVEMKFVPDAGTNTRGFPDGIKFQMELLIGSIGTSDEPESAKDLKLENLSFDQIKLNAKAH